MALVAELTLQLEVILHDAVLDDHHAPARITVRVCILFGHVAVSRPTRVADAQLPLHRLVRQHAHQPTQFAHTPANIEHTRVVDRNAGRVITAVFETSQPVHNNGSRIPWTHVSYNPTHRRSPSSSRRLGHG